MSRRYRVTPVESWDEQAANTATGCAILLIVGAFIALFQAARPRPGIYHPETLLNPAQRTTTSQSGSQWLYGVMAVILFGAVAFIVVSIRQIGLTELFVMGTFLLGAIVFTYAALRPNHKGDIEQTLPNWQPQNARVYTIYPSRDEADYAPASKLVHSLLATSSNLAFQIMGTSHGTRWQIIDPHGTIAPQVLIDTIRSHANQATVLLDNDARKPIPTTTYPFFRKVLFFGLANEFVAPTFQLDLLRHYDPLQAITKRLSYVQAKKDERITYSLVTVIPTFEAKKVAADRVKEGLVRPLSALTQDQRGNEIILDARILDAKLSETLYHAFLAVTLESRDEQRINELAAIVADVSHFALPGYNHVRTDLTFPTFSITNTEEDNRYQVLSMIERWSVPNSGDEQWRSALMVLSPTELASLWHLPNDQFTAPSIMWAGLGTPEELTRAGSNRIVVGDVNEYGRTVPISIPIEERSTHQYITGKTRMGKSTLLHNLIHQDIQMGLGTIVIDPHGKLVDDVLSHSIPLARQNDVVLLECGNTAYPVPLNPFRRPQGISFDSVFNQVYWTLRKIYESIWLEGRTDMAFRNVLLALLLDPEATPLDIQRVFLEPAYRDYLIMLLKKHEHGSISAVRYWEAFSKMSRGQQAEIYEPILSRTGAFLGSRHLEHMTCHPNTLNIRQLIEQKKIVLINLSGEAVKKEVEYLGAIFLSGLFLASEAMGYVSGDIPRMAVYIDEVERILSTPIPDMLSQARKFGLSLTLANQYLDQLQETTTQSIFGNVGTKFVFELGEKDARLLARYTEPEISLEKLMNLGPYHMAVKTRVGEKSLPAVIARTRRAPTLTTASLSPDSIRRRSRAALGLMDQSSIRDFLNRRYVEPKPEPQSPEAPTQEPNGKGKRQGDGLKDYE